MHLSLSRFMVCDASEVRRPHDGWGTVHGPAVPPARVPGYPQRTVNELPRLVPSFEAALQVHMGCIWDSARPPEFPGVPHTLAPDNLIGINSIGVLV
jgi:hypothetical protein